MEDWKQKLVDAVRKANDTGSEARSAQRMSDLSTWLKERTLDRVTQISHPAHVVELMELLDRWHDEDVATQPCAVPAPPANPFIEREVRQNIRTGTLDDITVKGVNFEILNIQIRGGCYRPDRLRILAKQLTDLADAHETIYSPDPADSPDDL